MQTRYQTAMENALKTVSSLKKFYSVPRDTDEDMLDGHTPFVATDP